MHELAQVIGNCMERTNRDFGPSDFEDGSFGAALTSEDLAFLPLVRHIALFYPPFDRHYSLLCHRTVYHSR